MLATCSGSITTQLCYRRPILSTLPLTSLYLPASPSQRWGGGHSFIRVYMYREISPDTKHHPPLPFHTLRDKILIPK